MDTISHTARWTAAARARESARPDRLFNDPFAAELAGVEGFAQMARIEATTARPGTMAQDNPYLVVRTRAIDDFLEEMSARGVRQVVLLAAGLDARAFRLAWAQGTNLFELDRAELLSYKQGRLARLGATPRCTRHAIAVDLTADWTDRIAAAGFDPSRPSAWVLEGLLMYLQEPAAQALLTQVASMAAAGSELYTDLVGRSLLTSPLLQPYLAILAEEGAPWTFGSDEPEAFFAGCGWDATVRQSGEVGAQFGRWPYPILPRGTSGVPQSFFIRARVA